MQVEKSSSARLLLPAAEAAEMLSMGRSTFWREVKKGTVPPAIKIGGLTRWRVSDLQRFVEELDREPLAKGAAAHSTD